MESLNNRTIGLKRTLNASIEKVWQAWSVPEEIAKWWGPGGMEIKIVEHDFKPGGKWQFTMLMPNGNEFITQGVYQEIIAPTKIISSADFKPMTQDVEIQVLFKALKNQTQFIFNVVHTTAAYCKEQEQMGFKKGWEATFDRLENYVTGN